MVEDMFCTYKAYLYKIHGSKLGLLDSQQILLRLWALAVCKNGRCSIYIYTNKKTLLVPFTCFVFEKIKVAFFSDYFSGRGVCLIYDHIPHGGSMGRLRYIYLH